MCARARANVCACARASVLGGGGGGVTPGSVHNATETTISASLHLESFCVLFVPYVAEMLHAN